MNIYGFMKAMLPHVEKVELGPVQIEDHDKCWRLVRIITSGCTLELVLTGQTPDVLKAVSLRK